MENSAFQDGAIRRIFRYVSWTITKNWFAFNKKLRKTLAKGILTPLGLTTAASETDAATQKKIFGFGINKTTSIIWNQEMDDVMKANKSLEESSLLSKSFCKTIRKEAKE